MKPQVFSPGTLLSGALLLALGLLSPGSARAQVPGGGTGANQQVGGGIAWSIGEIPTIVLAITTVWLWARSDKRERVRIDRAADRDGGAELAAYNEMLDRMGKR